MVNKNDFSDLIKFLIATLVALVFFGVLAISAYNWEGKSVLNYLDARLSDYLNAQWNIK